VYRGYSAQIVIMTQQCGRCGSPLASQDADAESSICRDCLRALDADVATKRRILFSSADTTGELLSAFA
jgi:hypothetical protein